MDRDYRQEYGGTVRTQCLIFDFFSLSPSMLSFPAGKTSSTRSKLALTIPLPVQLVPFSQCQYFHPDPWIHWIHPMEIHHNMLSGIHGAGNRREEEKASSVFVLIIPVNYYS